MHGYWKTSNPTIFAWLAKLHNQPNTLIKYYALMW